VIALVVPSHSETQLDAFLARWLPRRWWDRLVVVEDAPERTYDLPPAVVHVAHAEIEADLGAKAWIVSRGDSAIRSYGFLLAWRLGAETIFTLDHDCYPHPGQDVRAGHLATLHGTPRWASSVPGLRVRGLPYGNAGTLPVHLSVGLWSNVPDLDGVCQLARGIPTDFAPPVGSRVLARGQYTPVCGMNLAFRREFAPLAYFGLQGQGQPFARFDDIWFGVIAKRICDRLDWNIAVGEPWVRHERASDPFVNLAKEAPGIGVHERLWRFVDGLTLTASTPAGCMRDVAAALPEFDPDPYWSRLGRAMTVWAGLFA
jgi:reversibly glycosylated polypeptide / UDP-arabinopyranose mutase